MKMASCMRLSVVGAVLLLCSGCASLKPAVETGAVSGEQRLSIKASSFSFDPNNVVAKAGVPLVLSVENVSGNGHNITVEAPDGTRLTSADLPGKKTVEVRVNLSKPGIYPFYCDKPMHPSLGMKGQIEAR